MRTVQSHNPGFPRIGPHRELKNSTEAYWKEKIPLEELLKTGTQIRHQNWQLQKDAGIDLIPSNDFSFYDQMLDMSCLLGAVPERFGWNGRNVDIGMMFRMARGVAKISDQEKGAPAMEMTKWFDTNYHYIVPEFTADMDFRISSEKIFDEYEEARDLGIETMPVLIGPLTYLWLGKAVDEASPHFDKFRLMDKLVYVYNEIFQRLEKSGVKTVQIDEPILTLDLPENIRKLFHPVYAAFRKTAPAFDIMVNAYFGELRDNFEILLGLPVDLIHVDGVRGVSELIRIAEALPDDKRLSVGIVNGRNIWKNDLNKSLDLLKKVQSIISSRRLLISPSCSLLHSPVTLDNETAMENEIKSWLAFASEKLTEVSVLAKTLSGEDISEQLKKNQQVIDLRKTSSKIHNPNVKQRVESVKREDTLRHSPYPERRKIQRQAVPLPDYPTTTIGSFPQTPEVRQARLKRKKGEWSQDQYEAFLKSEIQKTVRFQEELDIDVLVHGESERNDMVEYFGEQMEGFLFTQNGWVQSFGSRYVKPPIIFGDVSRPKPMTVRWSVYAQSLTNRPMKGMLTGPVTILQWSFVRDDQPCSATCRQIALAIRDEVQDLEKAGIRVIQIDEPALREGLPLRRSDRSDYLNWAVENYRLSTCGVEDVTQIHTHMCYAEFNDIIKAIAALDTDVISIESSRSKMELLDAFVDYKYPSEIGPGVYDIHSPRIPEEEEMVDLLEKASEVLPLENLWVNPDCGLKTRRWEEVEPALKKMVGAAKKMRNR